MKRPRISTDLNESWDKAENITREITRYITKPDGTKRTEKETVFFYIPAPRPTCEWIVLSPLRNAGTEPETRAMCPWCVPATPNISCV
jgi:hypothetical protein